MGGCGVESSGNTNTIFVRNFEVPYIRIKSYMDRMRLLAVGSMWPLMLDYGSLSLGGCGVESSAVTITILLGILKSHKSILYGSYEISSPGL